MDPIQRQSAPSPDNNRNRLGNSGPQVPMRSSSLAPVSPPPLIPYYESLRLERWLNIWADCNHFGDWKLYIAQGAPLRIPEAIRVAPALNFAAQMLMPDPSDAPPAPMKRSLLSETICAKLWHDVQCYGKSEQEKRRLRHQFEVQEEWEAQMVERQGSPPAYHEVACDIARYTDWRRQEIEENDRNRDMGKETDDAIPLNDFWNPPESMMDQTAASDSPSSGPSTQASTTASSPPSVSPAPSFSLPAQQPLPSLSGPSIRQRTLGNEASIIAARQSMIDSRNELIQLEDSLRGVRTNGHPPAPFGYGAGSQPLDTSDEPEEISQVSSYYHSAITPSPRSFFEESASDSRRPVPAPQPATTALGPLIVAENGEWVTPHHLPAPAPAAPLPIIDEEDSSDSDSDSDSDDDLDPESDAAKIKENRKQERIHRLNRRIRDELRLAEKREERMNLCRYEDLPKAEHLLLIQEPSKKDPNLPPTQIVLLTFAFGEMFPKLIKVDKKPWYTVVYVEDWWLIGCGRMVD